MQDPNVVSTCNRLISKMENESGEIDRFMKGDIADDYRKLLRKELDGMKSIKNQIMSFMNSI